MAIWRTPLLTLPPLSLSLSLSLAVISDLAIKYKIVVSNNYFVDEIIASMCYSLEIIFHWEPQTLACEYSRPSKLA